MSRFIFVLIAFLALAGTCLAASEVRFGERPFIDIYAMPDASVEQGILRIKLTPALAEVLDALEETDGKISSFGIPELDELNRHFEVSEISRHFYFPAPSKYAWRHRLWGLHLWFELRFESKDKWQDVVMAYRGLKDVVTWAEPEYKKTLFYDPKNMIPIESSSELRWSSNDPRLTEQWHYNNTGQQSGTVDCDIDLFEAWDIEKGHPEVVVAVIDQGIQASHPDLAANVWVNTDEIAGDGIDNDFNGYVDDINGYNFAESSSTITAGDHGCHTSGTIAAVTNNGIGVAGIAGGSGTNPGVKVMSCEVFGSSNAGFDLASIYGADNGAAISQNSWGYTYVGAFEQTVLDAIDYFNANGGGNVLDGGITIYAAGNSNASGSWYPGCYSGCFAVAGTNNQDIKSWYSNYDTWVKVSAPGGETNTVTDRGVLSTISGSSYAFYQGTSMACPHTSGEAALIVSYAYRNGTVLSPADLATIISSNVDNHYGVNPTFAGMLGSGRINAYSALLSVVPGMPSCSITAPTAGQVFDLNTTITVNVTASDSDGSITQVAFYIDDAAIPSYTDYAAPYSWNWNTNGVSGGAHTIKAIATDNSSNSVTRSVSVSLLAPATEGFESGTLTSFPWATSGDLPWLVQSADVFSGTYAAKSGAIDHSQSSTLNLTMNIVAAGNIYFHQKISSESGYDYLRFYIDDVQQAQWSGAGAWTQVSYPVATGSHTFKWTYSKDGSVVANSDCAYIDHIILPDYELPNGLPPSCVITSPATGTTLDLGSPVNVEVSASDTDGTVADVSFYLNGATTPAFTDENAPYLWTWDTSGYSAGSYSIKAVARDNDDNTAEQTISVTLMAPPDEGFESGDFAAFPWLLSGDLPWVVQTADKYSGTYAAKSGAITHNQSSSLSITLNITSAGNVTFMQKVSSEATYDFLRFYIDDVMQGEWSGAGSWTQQSYAVTTGIHTFKWTYSKDGSVDSGSNCGYVDHIAFPAFSPISSYNPARNLTASAGNGFVALSWQAPLSGTPTGYAIYRNTAYLTTVTGLSYTDTAVVNGSTYSYYLTAVYSGGTSDPTATVNATPSAMTYGIIGTGTSNSNNNTIGFNNLTYKSNHTQAVYTAAELNAAGITGPAVISQLGFFAVTQPNLALPNFVVRMKHTTEANATNWQSETGMVTVYTNPSFMPSIGDYQMLQLATPFEWNGIDNLVVDTAFGLVSAWSNTGTWRYTSTTSGYRRVYSDTIDQTNVFTGGSVVIYRPNIRIGIDNEAALTPPEIIDPIVTEDGFALGWDPVPNATIYRIYRSFEPYGTYELLGTSTTPSFEDTEAHGKAFYKVIAFDE